MAKKAKKKAPPKRSKPVKTRKVKAKPARKAVAKKAHGVNPIPDGLSTVTANLVLKDCSKAIDFYKRAFGAQELSRAMHPDGVSVWHASLRIGSSVIFLNDPDEHDTYRQPSGNLWVYGSDVDRRFQRAVDAGAQSMMPLWDTFWGDRMGMVVDPFGQRWTLSQKMKDMTPAQMKVAGEEFSKSMAAQQQPTHPTSTSEDAPRY